MGDVTSPSVSVSIGVALGAVVVLVEAGHDAEVGAALGAVVLRLPPEDPAALVHGVPAEVAAERRAGAHGGRVAGALRLRRVGRRGLERRGRRRGRHRRARRARRACGARRGRRARTRARRGLSLGNRHRPD